MHPAASSHEGRRSLSSLRSLRARNNIKGRGRCDATEKRQWKRWGREEAGGWEGKLAVKSASDAAVTRAVITSKICRHYREHRHRRPGPSLAAARARALRNVYYYRSPVSFRDRTPKTLRAVIAHAHGR
ncbi:hypothetical protein EVAR_11109_1 [Eumeta japonica]|uniref:Uncharacterized protein n=1 Tax=Eumeta variegata TaxID=151549 RepID=A0A4C1U490_EUMVA|nr:hypothetical protein EVAR_11109_1 [Eumeta japonica]